MRGGGRLRCLWLGPSFRLFGLATLGVACLATAPLQAQRASQQGESAQQGPQGRRARAADLESDVGSVPPGELVKMLDAYAAVQAQDALRLSDSQYGEFVTRLRRLQEIRRRSQRERNLIVLELRKLSRPQAPEPADEAILRSRLQALRDHDERAVAELRKAYDAVDEVLDLRQQARFRAFEETIERRKLDLIVRARERAARPRGGG